MAKERVTVCLPPCAPDDLRPALAAAMAPFEYDAQADRPAEERQGEWDYWYVSSGGLEFTVRSGHEDDPLIVRDGRGEDRPPRPRELCDGGPKGLLDLDTGRRRAAEAAGRRWDAWRAFSALHPPSLPYSYFRTKTHEDPGAYPEHRVLEDFARQPVIRAVRDDPALDERFGFDPVGWFGEDRDAFVRRDVDAVLPTIALLTLDGRWLSGGSHPDNVYFNEYVDSLPDDTILVRVLYHG
ncbi:hypothetical protein ABTX77_39635 [Streptomyces sp. NPDC097704]|uniref:hypothetical protein n=1 Tax=Streptomyces sp. NPDC097704 TaxID=3157101 RepID=UPI0033237198